MKRSSPTILKTTPCAKSICSHVRSRSNGENPEPCPLPAGAPTPDKPILPASRKPPYAEKTAAPQSNNVGSDTYSLLAELRPALNRDLEALRQRSRPARCRSDRLLGSSAWRLRSSAAHC